MATGHGRQRHKRARRRLLAELVDGDPCARCGRPMHHWEALEADHRDVPLALDPDGLPDALSHRRCNAAAGAYLAALLNGRTTRPHAEAHMERIRQQVIASVAHLHPDDRPAPPRAVAIRSSRTW